MTPELKRRIQYILAAAIVLTAVRTGYVLYSRHAERASDVPERSAAPPLDADYYVTPKKLNAYDLKSVRELTKQPVWMKEGYRYTYFPYLAASRSVDFAHEAGELLPLQKLEIKDVVLVPTPESARQNLPGGAVLRGEKQVMALFDQDGRHYAVPAGTELGGDYRIYADEMFFIQDPKQLYKHWPADVWDAVDKHQVKPGMNELQADFAIGMGLPQPSNEDGVKTVQYPNGGKPVRVMYRDGKAVEIKRE
jgi:hypothetical protein